MHAAVAVCDLFASPDGRSSRLDQLLFGEVFDLLDISEGFGWGRARRDGVIGWVRVDDLQPGAPRATHRVDRLDGPLPFNALVVGEGGDGLVPLGRFERDLASVAERFLGVPHALGARSSQATDCSGLVQQALYACGLPGPRSARRQAELGQGVSRSDTVRGDVVVWPHAEGGPGWTGHSGLMLDAERLVHASGRHGCVVIEALIEADAHCRGDGFGQPVFRRLP